MQGRDFEGVATPRREIEVEAAHELSAVTVISCGAEQVAQGNGLPRNLGPGQADIALALVVCIVDRDEHALAVKSLPAPDDARIPGPVALPGRHALEQTPRSVEGGMVKGTQQIPIE